MMINNKFIRIERPIAKEDGVGSVKVTIALTKGNTIIKGNIIRSLTIQDSKVSEVFAYLEKSLF